MNLPRRTNTRTHTPEGHFENYHRRTIGRMPSDRTLEDQERSGGRWMTAPQ
jgi:hypothetical protein